jgi:hypothetical protein
MLVRGKFLEPAQAGTRNDQCDELTEPWQQRRRQLFDIEDTSMLRLTRTLAAIVLVATLTPAAAYAFPLGKALHLHPKDSAPDGRVTIQVRNEAPMFRDIKIEGRTYTILPHRGVLVTAPAGTQIFAASTAFGLHRGDLIATVASATENETLVLR